MSDLKIRAANEQDAEGIWRVLKPVFRAGKTYAIDPNVSRENALQYWCDQHFYVAEDLGFLGTYYIHENRPGGGAHYCNCGFVTAPEAQGRGVARGMIEHALEEAKGLGFQGMVFNFVVANNTRAVETWAKYGFDTVGRVPDAFFDGESYADTLVMFRRL